MPQRQIINGGFMDSFGKPLNGGTMKMRLSTDAVIGATGTPAPLAPTGPQVCAGVVTSIALGPTGSVSGVVNVWPNDQMVPRTTVYFVKVYTPQGQLVWQGQQTVPSGASGPFDLNNWVPFY